MQHKLVRQALRRTSLRMVESSGGFKRNFSHVVPRFSPSPSTSVSPGPSAKLLSDYKTNIGFLIGIYGAIGTVFGTITYNITNEHGVSVSDRLKNSAYVGTFWFPMFIEFIVRELYFD